MFGGGGGGGGGGGMSFREWEHNYTTTIIFYATLQRGVIKYSMCTVEVVLNMDGSEENKQKLNHS